MMRLISASAALPYPQPFLQVSSDIPPIRPACSSHTTVISGPYPQPCIFNNEKYKWLKGTSHL